MKIVFAKRVVLDANLMVHALEQTELEKAKMLCDDIIVNATIVRDKLANEMLATGGTEGGE
jgi:hypothetical protein